MFGISIRIGWYGIGRHDDLFTRWLDLGVIGLGFTPFVARARVNEVAARYRRIREAVPALVSKVRE